MIGYGIRVACVYHENGTGSILDLLPRRTRLSRRLSAVRTTEQVVAANVDLVFLVLGLDRDYSLRRMERLLVVIYESGAQPFVILNKADCVDDSDGKSLDIERASPGVPVLVVSPLEEKGSSKSRISCGPCRPLHRWAHPGSEN